MQDWLRHKYDLKEMELNSLLEVTQAINSNLSEDALYKIFNFTLRANLNLKKLVLYVKDEKWHCKVNFGTAHDFPSISLDERLMDLRSVTFLDHQLVDSPFAEFQVAIPVAHKNTLLAFVFIGGAKDDKDIEYLRANTKFIQALSNIIIVAIENKKLARRQLKQEAFRKELEIARHVQQFLFPKNLPNNENLRVEASYLPHQSIGGDYYDFIEIDPDNFLLCIADVSGKGIPAALLMSNFQASLRTLVRQTINLREIVHELNYHILQNANGENFITFFVAIYNKKSKTMRYVNAGHNQPFLIKNQKDVFWLDKGSTILGCFKYLPFLNEGSISGMHEFFLFAYTDGLTETFNEQDEEYGEDRLKAFLLNNLHTDLGELHKLVFNEVERFKGSQSYKDDITILSCKVKA
jgi:phosphoserine phosphatase RsbU/P